MLLEQAHKASIADKIEMPANDYKNMLGMLSSIQRHHTAGGLLDGAQTEQSYYHLDSAGILRKCRTDAVTPDGQFVVDLKTTDDVSEAGFGRTIAQRRYHVQGAWYLDILRGLYGDDAPKTFVFVAAQKNRPFDVAVHFLTPDQIELGRMLYRNDLAQLIECKKTGIWHGTDGGNVIEAKLPAYEMNKLSQAWL
jgi:exodeoxyribonuclease VIII